MNILFMAIICLVTLAAAGWAHLRIRSHTPATRFISHSVLIVTGLAFGWVVAFVYTADTYTQDNALLKLLVFLSAFGVVHVPAAVILQLKRVRHKDRD
jgi:hypothetical protein